MTDTGGDRDKLKNYMNVEFPHLLGKNSNSDKQILVLSVVPIPLLHTILLNPCNHILKHLSGEWPKLEDWLKSLHVVRDKYHGEKFEGKEIIYGYIIVTP